MDCAEASRYYGLCLQQERVQSALSEGSWVSLVQPVCSSVPVAGLVLSSRQFGIHWQGPKAALVVRGEMSPSEL